MNIIPRFRRPRERQSQEAHPSPRTIVVTARIGSRFSRLRIRQPTVAAEHPYDVGLAAELLRNTGQLPENKRDLLVVLAEYRHALCDLVTTHNAATET